MGGGKGRVTRFDSERNHLWLTFHQYGEGRKGRAFTILREEGRRLACSFYFLLFREKKEGRKKDVLFIR